MAGRPRPGELALTGPLAEASLAALCVDTAITGCCGLTSATGPTSYDLDDAALRRTAIASVRRRNRRDRPAEEIDAPPVRERHRRAGLRRRRVRTAHRGT
ncbi:hypothetical protein [Actinopolymorpha pittospori]|uniref:Uncharacterized protein n=1 Tax=Actinopolymorpha pittospori TaxID=648752 RepID=A0A927MQ27_9ACTN|nr:hypothetical protein [Actinopolymorpha pittospori]MBE1603989.1 hypothetical protein [Actinopolymorpha pittospori]